MQGSVRRTLYTLKSLAKLGVFMLALMLFASPTMACLLPRAALTASERACCRKMASQCEQAGMPKSHSCCQRTATLGDLSLIKASSPKPTQLALIAVHHLLNVAQAIPNGTFPSLLHSDSEIHGPPGLAFVTTSVLRI